MLQEKMRKRHGRKLKFSRDQKSMGNLMGNDSQMKYLQTSTRCSSEVQKVKKVYLKTNKQITKPWQMLI